MTLLRVSRWRGVPAITSRSGASCYNCAGVRIPPGASGRVNVRTIAALALSAALACVALPARADTEVVDEVEHDIAAETREEPATESSEADDGDDDGDEAARREADDGTAPTGEGEPVEERSAAGEDAAEASVDSPEGVGADLAETGIAQAPVAEDVDLSQPVLPPPAPEVEPPTTADLPPDLVIEGFETQPPLILLGEAVAAGTSARLSWSLDQRFEGIAVPTPVLVVNGAYPGPVLCLTAAVHGDELNGIEIVRRLLYELEADDLSGTVIGVPIVNLQGFRRGSRYLPDRRDLNRFFPGTAGGSSASRIAYSFFNEVIRLCDALVDIHTGSLNRTNLPQLRADMTVPDVVALTEGFGSTAVLHSHGAEGTLRRAAVEAGIPAVTLETGAPGRLQEDEIEHGTKGVETLLAKLGMTRRSRVWGEREPVYYQSVWVRADRGGLLFGRVSLGQRVKEGQVLGTITDPITNVRSELRSPHRGRVMGMAINQVVLPGFAAYRIGIRTTEDELVEMSADQAEAAEGESKVPDEPPEEDDEAS